MSSHCLREKRVQQRAFVFDIHHRLVKSGDNAGCFTATSGETTIDVGAKFGAEAQLNAAGTNYDLVRITIG